MQHNNGAYAKLAMGPLWAEILNNIQPIINADDRGPPAHRLALFSGHDTTILPLLVSLGPDVWDGEWPPYASMMIIEVQDDLMWWKVQCKCTDNASLHSYLTFMMTFACIV